MHICIGLCWFIFSLTSKIQIYNKNSKNMHSKVWRGKIVDEEWKLLCKTLKEKKCVMKRFIAFLKKSNQIDRHFYKNLVNEECFVSCFCVQIKKIPKQRFSWKIAN